MQRIKHILTGAYLFFFSEVAAQQIPFVSYTPKDGLVNNRVKKMYQDSRGQLYFLTFGGLSIYDGARFTNFTAADGLGSDMVNDAVEMGHDSVWIATNTRELNYYSNGRINKLKTADGFYPIINSFYKTKNGELFAASDDGLFYFADNRFTKLPFNKNEKDEDEQFLNTLFQAGNYLLIIPDLSLGKYRSSLLLYDITTKTIIANFKGIASISIAEIDNDILLSTTKGILVIDKGMLQRGKIIFKSLPSKFDKLKNNSNELLFYDSHKNLWASQGDKGISKIDNGGEIKKYASANGLLSNKVNGVFEDKESNLWFINDNYGVQKLVSNNIELISQPFGSSIQSLATNASGDSVYYLNMANKKIIMQTAARLKIISLKNIQDNVAYISVSGNNVYLNSAKNIYHFTTAQLAGTGVTPHLIYSTESGHTLSRSIVDANGTVIVQGTDYLIAIINPSTISRLGIKYYTDEGKCDSKGRIWVASRASELYVLKTNTADPKQYLELLKDFSNEIKIKAPRSVTVDKLDKVWVGTRENGLYCFSVNEKMEIQLLKHFTRSEGLTDNFITWLYCDKAGAVWAGTSSGIDKITWNKNECIIDNISKRSGLYPFISLIAEDDKHNILALTNDGGLVNIAAAKNNPAVFVPQLFIKFVKAGDSIFSPSNIASSFSYKQNNISVNVASPSFYDEKQTKYSYILEGSGNNNQSEPTTNASLNFINLAPGPYILKIRVDYPASRYPQQTITYSFTITPPWWQTWWFLLLVAFGAIGLVVFAVRTYYNSKLEKQKIILEKQQAIEKERSRIASDIHDDLGAGLSTLRFLSEKVKRNSFSDTTKNDAQKIVNNANELVQKMNELIWAMNENNDTLEDLLFYARSYAAEYGEENNLEIDIYLPEKIPSLMVTGEMRRNVFLTLKESLHNIVKHANAKNVTIHFKTDKNLFISIKDDGHGLGTAKGEGNGLKNMKKRIESIGGIFEITDGDGALIEMSVPLK